MVAFTKCYLRYCCGSKHLTHKSYIFSSNVTDQQEMFEREISRLRLLFRLIIVPATAAGCTTAQDPTNSHSNSRDLDSQFANLSLKHSDPNSGRDAVSGLRI
jgi:hypothetical protein